MKMSVKTLVAIGIGAALFFVLGRYAAIPSPVPNTNITLQYAVLGVFATLFGPIAGVLIGLIGHTLIDATSYGPWWSWIIASGVFGLVVGLFKNRIDAEGGSFGKKQIIAFVLVQLAAHLISWLLVAPTLDILIYAEPVEKIYLQGLVSAISNAVTTGIVGTLLLLAYSKTVVKKGSLKKG